MTIQKLLVTFSVFFLIILIICFATLKWLNLNFIDSFFPEVFGFALEGLIVVGFISLIQLKLEHKRKKDEKLELIASLLSLAANFLSSVRLVAHQHGAEVDPSEMADSSYASILKLRDQLLKIDDVKENSDSVMELRNYLKNHKSQLEAALPIAALISPLAVVSWQGFLTHINIFINSESSAGMFNAIESLRFIGLDDKNS
jgi:hypothetical protein